MVFDLIQIQDPTFIFFYLLGLRTKKLTAPMRKLLAVGVIYFGLIAISAATNPEQKAYDDFDSLVTDFSKKNCPFNRRIFTILENYYAVELRKTGETCVVQQPTPCLQCSPCQACICPYCPPLVETSTEKVTTEQVNLFFCLVNM